MARHATPGLLLDSIGLMAATAAAVSGLDTCAVYAETGGGRD